MIDKTMNNNKHHLCKCIFALQNMFKLYKKSNDNNNKLTTTRNSE